MHSLPVDRTQIMKIGTSFYHTTVAPTVVSQNKKSSETTTYGYCFVQSGSSGEGGLRDEQIDWGTRLHVRVLRPGPAGQIFDRNRWAVVGQPTLIVHE